MPPVRKKNSVFPGNLKNQNAFQDIRPRVRAQPPAVRNSIEQQDRHMFHESLRSTQVPKRKAKKNVNTIEKNMHGRRVALKKRAPNVAMVRNEF